MKHFIYILVWWFLSVSQNGWGGVLSTQGPFPNLKTCNDMRIDMTLFIRPLITSACWETK